MGGKLIIFLMIIIVCHSADSPIHFLKPCWLCYTTACIGWHNYNINIATMLLQHWIIFCVKAPPSPYALSEKLLLCSQSFNKKPSSKSQKLQSTGMDSCFTLHQAQSRPSYTGNQVCSSTQTPRFQGGHATREAQGKQCPPPPSTRWLQISKPNFTATWKKHCYKRLSLTLDPWGSCEATLEEEGGGPGLSFSSGRHIWGGSQQGGWDPTLGQRVTGGSAQGLAGGLGDGQEPWLSKLAVLAFHWNTHKQARYDWNKSF